LKPGLIYRLVAANVYPRGHFLDHKEVQLHKPC